MQDYLTQLNTEQREAVVHTEGASLIIAGAGSGKTRVLTYKIGHLLNLGNYASSILALTFTNKSAKEMKERISKIVSEKETRHLWMGTFHSIFSRILRMESEAIDYPSSFTIYDTADSKNLIKSILKDLKLDDKLYKPGLVSNRISAAKNNLITAKNYANNGVILKNDESIKLPLIYEIYRKYERQCKISGAMDFDDLLLKTNILFRDNPDILKKYQDKFKYILVDEYQDTNFSQYLIVKKLCEQHKNISVVGDDAQSIYSFRGARIENILNFKKDYPDYKLYKLERNYRSTQNIVNAANSIIAKNKGQIKKKTYSKNEFGNKINILPCETDREEGFKVSFEIHNKHIQDHYEFRNFAILYRTNAQSRVFEESLRKLNIPYKIYGGISFYQRKEIKDLLAYLRLTVNHNDQESLKRIINYPSRKIGQITIDKIETSATQKDIAMWDVIANIHSESLGLNNGTIEKISHFVKLIKTFSEKVQEINAFELANEIAQRTKIIDEFKNESTPEGITRLENIEGLLNAIQEFSTNRIEEGQEDSLTHFLEEVSLLTNQDNEKDEDFNKVTLMTIHSAKGLEFKNVYIVGLEENLFPSSMSYDKIESLEEERRLFYVALTRAETNVTLSFAHVRYKWGNLQNCTPSRFFKDIDEDYLNIPEEFGDKKEENHFKEKEYNYQSSFTKKNGSFNNSTPPTATLKRHYSPPNKIIRNKGTGNPEDYKVLNMYDIKEGTSIEHQQFGKGSIIQLEGEGTNAKAVINFNGIGQKKLLLKFAKLKLI